MISIEHMQFAGIVLTSALTVMLALLLPHWQTKNEVFSRSRRLMTVGTLLLPIQFTIQYTFHLRTLGVTQAVFVNLLLFIPYDYFMNIAVLYLLRQGKIKCHEWTFGIAAYVVVLAMLSWAKIADGMPFMSDSPETRTAEIASAVMFLIIQLYYGILIGWDIRRIKRALAGYYDSAKDEAVQWISTSVILLVLWALLAPIAIFMANQWVTLYTLTLFFSIFYCVISFYSYGIDHAGQQAISNAEANAKEVGLDDKNSSNILNDKERRHIEHAVNMWIANGGYLHSGITIQDVVDDIGIPRYMLTAWLRTTEWELFNPWLTHLRLKEAKRLIRLHPEWSNDTIAEKCGFSSRSYFQTVFRKNTGMTPAQYICLCKAM